MDFLKCQRTPRDADVSKSVPVVFSVHYLQEVFSVHYLQELCIKVKCNTNICDFQLKRTQISTSAVVFLIQT